MTGDERDNSNCKLRGAKNGYAMVMRKKSAVRITESSARQGCENATLPSGAVTGIGKPS